LENIKMSEQKPASTEAKKTIDLINEGKTPKLLSLVPKGQSPKLYLDLIKTQIMGVDSKNQPRPDDDLLLFLYVAKRTGLDPLTKQIFAIYRWNSRQGREVMTIQSSIDGMRLVAQRTGEYAGQDDVQYLPIDEATKYPKKASVTVYKMIESLRVAFVASARWAEYVQTDAKGMPTQMWDHMPYLMLGKCAEALALRKAFPNELSGVYAEEEMAQSTNVLSGIAAPDRFNKKIEVLHGAPDETPVSTPPVPAEPGKAPEVIDIPAPVIVDTPAPDAPKVILGTTQKPDFKAMQNALKPKSIEELQARAKEAGKRAAEKEKEKPLDNDNTKK
jgi:phage recombination protein Bet